MQMAIKFVVDNCHAIGCDPDNVSIFGESAGGSAISYLIMGHEISQVSGTCHGSNILLFGSVLFSDIVFVVFPHCNSSITMGNI